MKILPLICCIYLFCSCSDNREAENKQTNKKPDTVIVKIPRQLTQWDTGHVIKSYSCFWIAGKDTSDLTALVSEWKPDSSIHITLNHRKPMLFSILLSKFNDVIPEIEKEFNVSRLRSVSFELPIYYLDLSKVLSAEYEKRFGQKNVSYEKLDDFLLTSTLNTQLNNILRPLDKRVEFIRTEKFHILLKKNYNEYLYNMDFSDYPEFVINGHLGMTAYLKPIN